METINPVEQAAPDNYTDTAMSEALMNPLVSQYRHNSLFNFVVQIIYFRSKFIRLKDYKKYLFIVNFALILSQIWYIGWISQYIYIPYIF